MKTGHGIVMSIWVGLPALCWEDRWLSCALSLTVYRAQEWHCIVAAWPDPGLHLALLILGLRNCSKDSTGVYMSCSLSFSICWVYFLFLYLKKETTLLRRDWLAKICTDLMSITYELEDKYIYICETITTIYAVNIPITSKFFPALFIYLLLLW